MTAIFDSFFCDLSIAVISQKRFIAPAVCVCALKFLAFMAHFCRRLQFGRFSDVNEQALEIIALRRV